MVATTRERYAVVSCHVERPLDGVAWARFASLQERRPGGFAIAALIRPADPAAGEDESVWVERAREAAARGPLGHHTHWTAPDHARPTRDGTGDRVLAEGRRLRELAFAPTLFCGGGWYTDLEVAEACAELKYVDCTARAERPAYLASGEPWALLSRPASVRLPSGRLLSSIPTTHSLGDLGRAFLRRTPLPQFVHTYFHDTDLLGFRRRALVALILRMLAKRARPTDLDTLAAIVGAESPEIRWNDVARI